MGKTSQHQTTSWWRCACSNGDSITPTTGDGKSTPSGESIAADIKLRRFVRRSESITGETDDLMKPMKSIVLLQPMNVGNSKKELGAPGCERQGNNDANCRMVEAQPLNIGMDKEELIKQLKAGNERYRTNAPKKKGGGDSQHRAQLASGQSPPIAIVGCADSRVPPELVFDTDAGELFTLRVAGNVVNTDNLASIEYAVKCLGTKLVIVLGHTRCGAVAAACGDQLGLTGHLPMLMHQIRPAIKHSKRPVHDNVKAQLEKLEASMGNFGQDIDLVSAGAVFNVDSGKVDFL